MTLTATCAGRFTAAIETGRSLLAILDGRDEPRSRAEVELALGTALMACDRRREALAAFQRARHLLRTHGLPCDFARAWFDLGLDCAWLGRLTLARAAFQRSAALCQTSGKTRDLRRARVLLACTLMRLGEPAAAEVMGGQAGRDLDLLDPFDRATLHLTEAEGLLLQGRFDQAEQALAWLYRAGSELGDPRIMADSLHRLALVKLQLDDPWAARCLLSEALAGIAGLGGREAEDRILALRRATRPARWPGPLQWPVERQSLRSYS